MLHFIFLTFHVAVAISSGGGGGGGGNPFTPKSYVIRYWNKKISNDLPKPSFLINKASPLTAADCAAFTKLANDRKNLSDHLRDFCTKANLFCPLDSSQGLKIHQLTPSFAKYDEKDFSTYGSKRRGPVDSLQGLKTYHPSFEKYDPDSSQGSFEKLDYDSSQGLKTYQPSFEKYNSDSPQGLKTYHTSFDKYDYDWSQGLKTYHPSFEKYDYDWSQGLKTYHPSFEKYDPDSSQGLKTYHPSFKKYDSDSSQGLKIHQLTPSFEKYDSDSSQSLKIHQLTPSFLKYDERDFSTYGSKRLGMAHTFQAYSGEFSPDGNNFRWYSRGSIGDDDTFAAYAAGTNMPKQSFNGYGVESIGGEEQFRNYNKEVNGPNLRFAAYSEDAGGRSQTFTEYATEANSGSESFTNYGKDGDGDENAFTNYAASSNIVDSDFRNYSEFGNGGNDSFASYGADTNVPQNAFRNYAADGNGAAEKFESYRVDSNGGTDEFRSYGKESDGGEFGFENYGTKDLDGGSGSSEFTGYGRGAVGQAIDFTVYARDRSFKEYAKEGITFSQYTNESSSMSAAAASSSSEGKMVNKRVVEEGRFFREELLKNGTIMPMPDIRDKMPKRSFLPRVIASKLPFSAWKVVELQSIFHVRNDSSMAKMFRNSLNDCKRAPNPNETKRCVASMEDMIDFAISVLGRNVTVRTMENTRGYNSNVMIGEVKGINGGEVTKSVSCHENLFPYLVYYCHSVPKVRVYEAEILDPKSTAKINYGVAICHLDTTSWSASHGAFVALGPGPGKIEVCHWIFENDMIWTMAD